MRRHLNLSAGLSLLELLLVIALLSVGFLSFTQLVGPIVADWRLVAVSQAFIQSAQRARALSLRHQQLVLMHPIHGKRWDDGWELVLDHQVIYRYQPSPQVAVAWDQLKPNQGFREKVLHQKEWVAELQFENGYFAHLSSGGFLANRIIWRDRSYPERLVHVILGPGGRWRICKPSLASCSDS